MITQWFTCGRVRPGWVFLSNFDLQVGCYWIAQCHLKVDQYDLDDFAVDRHVVDGWDHFVVVVQSESQQWTHTHRRTEIFAIISMCYVHSRARDNTPMCVSLSSLCCSCVCLCLFVKYCENSPCRDGTVKPWWTAAAVAATSASGLDAMPLKNELIARFAMARCVCCVFWCWWLENAIGTHAHTHTCYARLRDYVTSLLCARDVDHRVYRVCVCVLNSGSCADCCTGT